MLALNKKIGFIGSESHDWNVLWMNSSGKNFIYEGLNEFQKVNHFPNSTEITRKDRLCFNIVKMQERYGKHLFDITPDTYVLPDEFSDFYSHFNKLKNYDQKRNFWIVKPACLSRGRGIYLVLSLFLTSRLMTYLKSMLMKVV